MSERDRGSAGGGIRAAVVVLGFVLVPSFAARPQPAEEGDEVAIPMRAPEFVQRDARTIDRLIEIEFRDRGEVLPGPVDDASFARRAHLGLVGRIPDSTELRAFLESEDPDKRAALIDALIASPGHTARMIPFWGDLLRARSRLQNGISGEPFLDRIARFVEEGEGYDDFVHDLLTAEGPVHRPGNGATGHLMRDRGMPEDSMANTVRVFLGTRIECAQCHDHPYDRWSQMDFFRMAAFTGGLDYRNPERGREAMGMDMQMGAPLEGLSREETRALRDVLKGTAHAIVGEGSACVRLPRDYAYEDAEAGAWVTARAPFGDALEYENPRPESVDAGAKKRDRKKERRRRNKAPLDEQARSREAFADWLTADTNPRFTAVLVNRLWKLVMGQGLVEPVDDFKDDTQALHPGLLARLERLMIELDHDVREFVRVLCHTRHFARPAVPSEELSPDRLATGPTVRRLSAEQLWDSMLTWVVEDVDHELGKARRQRAQKVYDDYQAVMELTPQELRERASFLALRRTDPEVYRQELRERQAERKAEERAERKLRLEKRAAEVAAIKKAIKRARRAGDEEAERRSREELSALALARAPRARPADLLRAVDLPSPAPDDHFLRQFGQSDREQIVSAHTDASVPQVLSLCNGFVEKRVLAVRDAVLMDRLELAPTTAAEVEEAYLSMLGRPPRVEELASWEAELDTRGAEGREDLVWTLANSLEFLFQR